MKNNAASTPKKIDEYFVMDIEAAVVGWVIGKSGSRIKEIQFDTGCKVWIDQDVPNNQPRKIFFQGSRQNISAATKRVKDLIECAPAIGIQEVLIGNKTVIIDCPASYIGSLIGKNGMTIKNIQASSGAKVSIIQSARTGLPCKVIISGNNASVDSATNLISNLLDQGISEAFLADDVFETEKVISTTLNYLKSPKHYDNKNNATEISITEDKIGIQESSILSSHQGSFFFNNIGKQVSSIESSTLLDKLSISELSNCKKFEGLNSFDWVDNSLSEVSEKTDILEDKNRQQILFPVLDDGISGSGSTAFDLESSSTDIHNYLPGSLI